MTHKYIVSVPGRAQPLCIEADSWKGIGDDGALFFKGEDQVASLAATDLIAKADCLPDFPALSQFAPPVPPFVELLEGMSVERTAEPVRGLDPVGHTTNSTHYHGGTPVFWPALACGLFGFVGGIGLTLARVWGV